MLYQREGEIAFAADLRTRVLNYVSSHPRDFVHLMLRRILAFWTEPMHFGPYATILALAALAGIIAAHFRGQASFPFFAVLAFYPLVYYLTYTFARYRHPIEPLMYILAGHAACEFAAYGKLRFEAER
jgi:hypothetical protein